MYEGVWEEWDSLRWSQLNPRGPPSKFALPNELIEDYEWRLKKKNQILWVLNTGLSRKSQLSCSLAMWTWASSVVLCVCVLNIKWDYSNSCDTDFVCVIWTGRYLDKLLLWQYSLIGVLVLIYSWELGHCKFIYSSGDIVGRSV